MQFYRLISVGLMALILLIGSGAAVNASPMNLPPIEQAYRTAAQLYANGDYEEAARSYRQLIDQGYGDSVLYYNLGQAHLQAGNLGQALWALNSARQLAPRDADIDAALAQTRERLARQDGAGTGELSPSGAVATGLMDQLKESADRWLTIDELAILALILWGGLITLLLAAILSNRAHRRWLRFAALSLSACLLMAVLALAVRVSQLNTLKEAVVVAEGVELNAGPGAEYPGKMSLPHGVEVNVLDIRGDWISIGLDKSRPVGWAPADAVAIVAPFSTNE